MRHGTATGYRYHQDADEKPCDACVAAKQEYDRNWRSTPERTKKSRAGAAAQARALRRLKDIYPDVYRVLYAEEKVRAFREVGLQPESVRSW